MAASSVIIIFSFDGVGSGSLQAATGEARPSLSARGERMMDGDR